MWVGSSLTPRSLPPRLREWRRIATTSMPVSCSKASRVSRCYFSATQAEDALEFGFDLFDEILEPDDGDGAWREERDPKSTVIDALAGYIWAGLGSAAASERWQYAHVVRAVVELGWSELLHAVVVRADADSRAFADQHFAFLQLACSDNGCSIGLARGALENAEGVRPAIAFLRTSLGTQHVLIRELAAQTLRTLAAAGKVDVAGSRRP